MSQIKTLDDILAEMGHTVSANPVESKQKPTAPPKTSKKVAIDTTDSLVTKPTPQQTSNSVLNDILSNTPKEPLFKNNKETNYLRWLAFYYLSKRELSRYELRQKLLTKDLNPIAIDELLVEFAEKGYQSDERCALMIIREAIRLGKGKRHIEQKFWQYKITLPHSLDELIQMAGVDSLSDGTILDNDDKDGINWLKLAIEARCKKYGNAIPKDPKDKAKQLRFLQYRGFEMTVCFDALKYTLDTIHELDW